jgi:hypothetical protein
MKKYILLLILLIFSAMLLTTRNARERVDLIVRNARIYTVDPKFNVATAFAVKDGKFTAVGSDRYIQENYQATEDIDAGGRAVYPGFNDGHSHFLAYGTGLLRWADLVGTDSFDDVLKVVSRHQKQYPSEWVLGRGWDQNDWKEETYPTKTKLDALFPDRPVVLTRIDGHAVLANSKALKIAGITAQTKIDGGEVILQNGQPTGVLIDNAAERMQSYIPALGKEEKTRALLEAQRKCFEQGLTTVTDAGLDLDDIMLIDQLQKQGLLKIRVYAMMSPTEANFRHFFPTGPYHSGKLTVSAVKLYIDGALGSRGALLLKPYSDMPGHYGLRLHPLEYYDTICRQAFDAGFQVNTHAIGDSGNRIVLHTYARFLKGKNDRRWRIEHAQIVDPGDFHYFGDYSIIPSIQSTHCTSDMYWAGQRLGAERLKSAYAYKQLLAQNGWEVNGTDFPIEDISPLKTFYAAVSRKDLKGWPPEGFQMENAVNRTEALYSITLWPARGSFDEKQKGSIEPGKEADFVILADDIMNCPEKDIPHVAVLDTYVSGEKVFGIKNEK